MIYSKLEEYIYSSVNISYIHVPKTLSYTRTKQSLLANRINRALEQLGIQPQTGKYQRFIYARIKFVVFKTHQKKSHTHTTTYF